MSKMFINQPALDFVTASSFDHEFFNTTKQEVIPAIIQKFDLNRKTLLGHVLQYNGEHYTDLMRKHVMFLGLGEQKGKPHFLFRVSGFIADEAYRQLLSKQIDFKLTRVDAQITCPCKQLIDPELWAQFNARQRKEENHRGYGRKVTFVTDNVKGHTLYIGSRMSGKFIRVYQKTLENHEPSQQETHYVRLEVELKNRSAKAFHENAYKLGLDLALYKILRWAERGLVDTPLLEEHKTMIKQFPEIDAWKEGEVAVLPNQTLSWWLRACEATSGALIDCMETREEFLQAIHRLMVLANDRGVLHNETIMWCLQTCRARAKQMLLCPKTRRRFVKEVRQCMHIVEEHQKTNPKREAKP